MVSPVRHYFLKKKGQEFGPYTLNQVAVMWVSGEVTADTFYRITNIDRWAPLAELDDTLRFVASSRPAGTPKSEQGTDKKSAHAQDEEEKPQELDASKRADAYAKAMREIDPTGEKARILSGAIQSIIGEAEPCWFSGHASTPSAALEEKMYYIVQGYTLMKPKKWVEGIVRIPRSRAAQRLHTFQNLSKMGSAMIVAVLFGFLSSGKYGVYCIFWFLGGLPLGFIIGCAISPKTPSGWKPYEEWKRHPLVLEKITQGWTDLEP